MSVTWPLDSTAYTNSTLDKHVFSKGSVTASLNYSAKVILAGEIHILNARLGDFPRHFWRGRMSRRSCVSPMSWMTDHFKLAAKLVVLSSGVTDTHAERGRVIYPHQRAGGAGRSRPFAFLALLSEDYCARKDARYACTHSLALHCFHLRRHRGGRRVAAGHVGGRPPQHRRHVPRGRYVGSSRACGDPRWWCLQQGRSARHTLPS